MRLELGTTLKRARAARGLSLEAASAAAKISQGYLHKLEAGRVNNPSPRVLQRLGDVLDVPYQRLMELADYFMPDHAPNASPWADPDLTEPMTSETQAPAPTFTELLRQLQAVRLEIAELTASQTRLAQAVEQLAAVDR